MKHRSVSGRCSPTWTGRNASPASGIVAGICIDSNRHTGDVNECLIARSVPYRRRLNEISRPVQRSGSTAGTRSFSKGTALESLLWDIKSPIHGVARSPTSKANCPDAHARATYHRGSFAPSILVCMSLPRISANLILEGVMSTLRLGLSRIFHLNCHLPRA